MKHACVAKILILLLLVGFSQAQLNALTFSGIFHSFRSACSQMLNHRLAKPLAIGTALTIAAGITGYFIKKDFNQKRDEYLKKYAGKFLHDDHVAFGTIKVPGRSISIGEGNDQVKIGQVDVLDQFSAQGSGGASCGYQTLKNCVALAHLAKGSDWSRWLCDPEIARQYFGLPVANQKAGTWRQAVIENRQRTVLQYSIDDKLTLTPPATIDESVRPHYTNLYTTFRSQYVQDVIKNVLSGQSVKVSLDSFVNMIQAKPNSEFNFSVDVNFAKDRKTIESYCTHIKADDTYEYSLENLAVLAQEYYTKTNQQVDLNGENTHAQNIQQEYARLQQSHADLADVPLTIIDSSQDKLEPSTEEIRQSIFNKKPLKHDVYLFPVHHGSHWMPVVLDTRDGGVRRYTLADSLCNSLRLYHGPLIDFINKLEGNNFAARVRETIPVQKNYGFGKYCSRAWRNFTKNWF